MPISRNSHRESNFINIPWLVLLSISIDLTEDVQERFQFVIDIESNTEISSDPEYFILSKLLPLIGRNDEQSRSEYYSAWDMAGSVVG